MLTFPSWDTAEKIFTLHTESGLFYKEYWPLLMEGQSILTAEIENMRIECTEILGRDPLHHWNMRLKPVQSAKAKLQRLGHPETSEAAISELHDVIAARVICAYIDDIYYIRKWFYERSSITVHEERDYIKHPKPNGYRSCHLIMRVPLQDAEIRVEIQLRTLAMDCWASLEHQMKYKNSKPTQEIIIRELKRCSDEIASIDWNLLSIRDMIENEENTQ